MSTHSEPLTPHRITAEELYASLLLLSDNEEKTVVCRCEKLYELLRKAAEEPLKGVAMSFSSLFSKLNYLLLEYGASQELIRSVHDARQGLRHAHKQSVPQLLADYPYYLRSVASFVALVYRSEIPSSLFRYFPQGKREKKVHTKRLAEVCRVIVQDWDEAWIEVMEEATGERLKIAYAENNPFALGSHTYLSTLLQKGTQLNLLRPRSVEGEQADVVYPELIILEPDFLVNVTNVASCFQPYGNSPLNYFLKRFERFRSSKSLALGHLSGILLDEALCGKNTPLMEQLSSFFRANALSMTACNLSPYELKEEGEKQKRHIQQGLSVLQETGRTKWEDCIVEPTFFSECLGITGRMDLLHLDKRLLLEQKSGKGEYDKAKEVEAHHVQLLLYQALLHYGFSRSNDSIRSVLLYSKYEQPVVEPARSPALLSKAFELRNYIVAWELYFAQHGFGCLDKLSPEHFLSKNVSERFWKNYIEPQLTAVLSPIQTARPRAKAYFYRLLQFIQQEMLCAKLGTNDKEYSGFAAAWQTSLSEKLKTGNIYHEVCLLLPEEGESIAHLHFSPAAHSRQLLTNFRKGDTIVLYPYRGAEPNLCEEMALRGVIVEMGAAQIGVELLNRQTSRSIFTYYQQRGFQWAVEHDLLESSFRSLFAGAFSFLLAPRERQEWVLFERSPRVDKTRQLRGDYGAFNELVLRSKQADDFFLLFGPPGTGKTSCGLLNIVKEELLEEHSSLLLMAYTHRAVDEICEKLIEAGIDFLRIGQKSSTEVPNSYLLEERLQHCSTPEAVKALVGRTRVICATTATINGNPLLLYMKSFSLAVVDEAAQLLEPHLIGLLSAKQGNAPAIRRFVFIGDHKQLPAVVQQSNASCTINDPLLREMEWTDCRLSLFERLYRRYADNPGCCYALTRQGRMHEEIAAFPNQYFYNNSLHSVPLPHQQAALLPIEHTCAEGLEHLLQQRVAFVAVTPVATSANDKVNEEEAEQMAIIATLFYKHYAATKRAFSPQHSLGIIVPYRNQIVAVQQALAATKIADLAAVTVDTVERFQGSQREIILYGFTIRHPYQLNFLTANTFEENGKLIDRKLNVVMTRAKEHLVLLGNPSLLEKVPLYRQLLHWVEE